MTPSRGSLCRRCSRLRTNRSILRPARYWLAPAVFGLRTITLWQALGILILSKILFGGFRGRPGYGGPWRRRMSERWQQMTPEEREKFRQGMFSRCGFSSAPAEESTDPGHV